MVVDGIDAQADDLDGESGKVSLNGSARAIALARRLLALSGKPTLKNFRFSAFATSNTLAA
jgi:hypothetical protein